MRAASLARGTARARLHMRAPRREVHALFLVHAKDGMHVVLRQESQVRIRAKASVTHQHVVGSQGRVECDRLGKIMGPQERTEHL